MRRDVRNGYRYIIRDMIHLRHADFHLGSLSSSGPGVNVQVRAMALPGNHFGTFGIISSTQALSTYI